MARVSYRRLAVAMVAELADRPAREVARSVVDLLASSGQKIDLQRLLSEVERELLRQHGHLIVRTTSARQLPTAQYEQIAAEISRRVGAKTHEIHTKVDPVLIGGVRVDTSDMQLDLSIRTQLDRLKVHYG